VVHAQAQVLRLQVLRDLLVVQVEEVILVALAVVQVVAVVAQEVVQEVQAVGEEDLDKIKTLW
jgi:hypothetical protein